MGAYICRLSSTTVPVQERQTTLQYLRGPRHALYPHEGRGFEDLEQLKEQVHDEYVILDSAGRLQIPPNYRKALGITKRAKIEMKDGEIVIKGE
jgi:hypothetical protein